MDKAITEKKIAHRYEHIDSLRGLAAISVIFYHIALFYPADNNFEKQIFSLIVDRVDLGKIAVTVFFAVSGFVIPFSLFKPSTSPLRDFAFSRFFRLYPAYWLSMILALLIITNAKFTPHIVLINATMLQQFFGVRNMIGVYWTLQIELIFYALCALMFAFGLLQKPKFVVAVLWSLLFIAFLLALARHVTGKNLPVALPLALSIMYFGFLWRALIMQNAINLRKPIYGILAGYIIIWPVIFYLAYGGANHQGMNYTLTYYFSLGIFVLGTTKLKINFKVTAYLGKISYSLYLVGSVGTVLCAKLLKSHFGAAPAYQMLILSPIVGICASSLIYFYLETPAIALGRSLAHSVRKIAPPTEREIEESEVI